MVLLGFTIVCVAFAAVTVANGSFPDIVRRQTTEAAAGAVLVPATLATFREVAPTGLALWDLALVAGFVALVGLAAARADRRVVLLALLAVAAAAVAGEAGIVAAAAGLGVAVAVAALNLRLPAPKALAGSLAALAILSLEWPEPAVPRTAVGAAVVGLIFLSALLRSSDSSRRRWLLAGGGVLVAGLFVSAGFALQAVAARDDLEAAVDIARAGLAAARDGDLPEATATLASAEQDFGRVRRSLDGLLVQPARLIPGLAQNQRAMAGLARAGEELASASVDASVDIDVSDLRLRGGQLDLTQLRSAQRSLSEVVGLLHSSSADLEAVASPLLAPVVADAVDRFSERLEQASEATSSALEIARLLPDLLGESGPRHWFLGLQGVSEARATGGIIGSHAILTTEGGRLTLGPVTRTAELNQAGDIAVRQLVAPRDYVRRYAPYEPERTWQNITLSPDGPSVAQVVEGLFPQSGGQEVDGVILLDHEALAALLRITGPVDAPAWPEPLTAENIGGILLHEQYLRFPRPERVDFLADAARAVFDRITNSELPEAAALGAALADAVAGRHIILHSTDDREQDLFARLGLTGALPPVKGDALALVTQNASGNKIDWFLHRRLRYVAEVDPAAGSVTAQVTVELENRAPARGLPNYVIGGTGPNPTARGVNRMLFSLYSPLEVEAAFLDGVPLQLATERELGRYVHGTTLSIPPGGRAVVELRLRGEIPRSDRYVLDVRSQPTAHPDELLVELRGPRGTAFDGRFTGDRDHRITLDADD